MKNQRLLIFASLVLAAIVILIFARPVDKKNPTGPPTDPRLFLEIHDEEGNFLCATPRCRGFYAEENLPRILEWITVIGGHPEEARLQEMRAKIAGVLASPDRLLISVRRRDPAANPKTDPQPQEGTEIDAFPYSPPPPESAP